MTVPSALVTTAPTGTDPFCADCHAHPNAERHGSSSESRAACAADTMSARLEELDDVARWVLDQDLRAAGTLNDFVAEFHARGAQSSDLARDVIDDELESVPAAPLVPRRMISLPSGFIL